MFQLTIQLSLPVKRKIEVCLSKMNKILLLHQAIFASFNIQLSQQTRYYLIPFHLHVLSFHCEFPYLISILSNILSQGGTVAQWVRCWACQLEAPRPGWLRISIDINYKWPHKFIYTIKPLYAFHVNLSINTLQSRDLCILSILLAHLLCHSLSIPFWESWFA